MTIYTKFRAIYPACVDGKKIVPIRGDLIRNLDTNNFINIVHRVYKTPKGTLITSVRYAKTKDKVATYLAGNRTRRFFWEDANWQIVKEYDLTVTLVPRVTGAKERDTSHYRDILLQRPIETFR